MCAIKIQIATNLLIYSVECSILYIHKPLIYSSMHVDIPVTIDSKLTIRNPTVRIYIVITEPSLPRPTIPLTSLENGNVYLERCNSIPTASLISLRQNLVLNTDAATRRKQLNEADRPLYQNQYVSIQN